VVAQVSLRAAHTGATIGVTLPLYEAPEQLTNPSSAQRHRPLSRSLRFGIARFTTDARLHRSAYGFGQLAGGRSVGYGVGRRGPREHLDAPRIAGPARNAGRTVVDEREGSAERAGIVAIAMVGTKAGGSMIRRPSYSDSRETRTISVDSIFSRFCSFHRRDAVFEHGFVLVERLGELRHARAM
jgi:hypothetical protein